ncbi:MAG TPA: TonB-dependent receptor [Steroidobacteraceae bacterium]|jgi:iron complex outermembrane receptor protein|nr:TonB-dependent receptor [Steroidobacteraceae bacterium]
MIKTHAWPVGLACTVTLLVAATPGHAQTPPAGNSANPSSGDTLEEVVVTAERRPEVLKDVPAAVTLVNAQQLADQHVYNIAELAQTTPALEMIQAFGGPGGGGQIRGIGTQSFTRSAEGAVGIVVDGISQGNVNVSNIFDVQHIEVLEGPQGTLFGLTSSAGVISILTNAPDPTGFHTNWHADYANKGTAGSLFGQETLQGVVNLPLSDISALRVSTSIDDNKGVEHNSFTGRDDTADNFGLRARYLLKLSDSVQLNVISDWERTVQQGAEGGAIASFTYAYANPALTAELASCGITPGFANQDRCANHPEEASDYNYGLSAQADVNLGAATLTSILAYRREETGPDSQDIQAVPQEIPQIWSTGVLTASRQYSGELRLTSNGDTRFEYTSGLYYSNYLTLGYGTPGAFFHVQLPFPPFEEGSATTTLTQTSTVSTAVYGQTTFHVTDALGLIAGARYTYESINDYQSPLGFQPLSADNPGASSLELTQNNISGKVGVIYKLGSDWTARATVVRGYKGPQASAATPQTPAIIVPAEIPWSYEVGIKGNALGGRLGVDFTLFDERDQNYQGQSCALSPVGTLACTPNSTNVTSRGAEFSINGRPVENLQLTLGYIYDQATYPDSYRGFDPSDLTGTTLPMGGLQLVGVPRNKLTFTGNYTVPLGPVGINFGTDVTYKSDIRLGYSPDPRFVFPSAWTVGAHIDLRSSDGRWGVGIFARDLTNSHQPLTLFGGPAFIPPGVVPFLPLGGISGVSGWVGEQSLREVGISADVRF